MLAKLREPIACWMALHQRTANPLFQFREAPVNGGLTGAERLGGRKGTAGASHREKVSQVVPVQHDQLSIFGFQLDARTSIPNTQTDVNG